MELTLFDLFELGGWAMWPLVVFSVATLALFVERAVILIRADLTTTGLRDRLVPLVQRAAWTEAVGACEAAPRRQVVAPVYGAALRVHARLLLALQGGGRRVGSLGRRLPALGRRAALPAGRLKIRA